MPREGVEEAYQLAIDFAARKNKHHFLTLFGETGTGKTHLALGIGWFWLINDYGLVLYWQAEDLFDDLRRGFKVADSEAAYNFDNLLKRVKDVDLLILDELGGEYPTPWVQTKMDSIINHRYLLEKTTVFTTNISPKELQERVASRISEGELSILECSDYRPIKRRAHEDTNNNPD